MILTNVITMPKNVNPFRILGNVKILKSMFLCKKSIRTDIMTQGHVLWNINTGGFSVPGQQGPVCKVGGAHRQQHPRPQQPHNHRPAHPE